MVKEPRKDTTGVRRDTEDRKDEDKRKEKDDTDAVANVKDTGGISSTSNVESHQHQQEKELLSSFTVPNPPLQPNSASNDKPTTLWMGDLDPWLDEDTLVSFWREFLHKDVSVKIIKPQMRQKSHGGGLANSGYCFINFESFEDAQDALSLNGQLLPDMAVPSQKQFPNNPNNQKKYFRLNWASKSQARYNRNSEYSLFVGDLSASTTEAHLLAFFQTKFPDSIKTVRVMTDPVSGKSRCFGFVRFSDETDRERALKEMNGVWLGGRPLRVALAVPRTSAKRYNEEDIQQGFGGIYFENRYPDQSEAYRSNDPNNTTVFVGGLSSQVNEATLYTLFESFGLILHIKVPPGKGCGFIKYSKKAEAERAIASMQGFIIGGNRIRLSWGKSSPPSERPNHENFPWYPHFDNSYGQYPSYMYPYNVMDNAMDGKVPNTPEVFRQSINVPNMPSVSSVQNIPNMGMHNIPNMGMPMGMPMGISSPGLVHLAGIPQDDFDEVNDGLHRMGLDER